MIVALSTLRKEKKRMREKKTVTIIKLLMIIIKIREHYQVIISIIVIFKLYTDKIKCKHSKFDRKLTNQSNQSY